MNQLPMGATPPVRFDTKAKLPPLPAQFRAPARLDAVLTRTVAQGLQLTRASTIALTRLQLALAGGDRRRAMAAIDRLHVLDGEIEHLVEGLPQPQPQPQPANPDITQDSAPRPDGDPAGDELMVSLNKHLADQKLALAFEKLALASGISGPDLGSAAALPIEDGERPALDSQPAKPEDPAAPVSVVDWHAFPEVRTVIWDRIPPKVLAFALTVLIAALIAAVVTMTLVQA